MNQMLGADPGQLRSLAQQFDQSADRLGAGRSSIGSVIGTALWQGADATRFRAAWTNQHSVQLSVVGRALRDAATSLRTNAHQQDQASAIVGGSVAMGAPAAAASSVLATKWDAMTDAQRSVLTPDQLEVYGSTDSVPVAIRDEANRMLLQSYLNDPLQGKLYGTPDDVNKFRAAERLAVELHDHPDAHLLLFEPTGYTQLHASIALGDVSTAKNVAVYVQGYDSAADKPNGEGISGAVSAISTLRSEMDSQLAAEGRGGESTATVVWMGYDSPPDIPLFAPVINDPISGIVNAFQPQYAMSGAPALASFAEGIREQNPDANLVAVGHSYGSYVEGLAAQQTSAFNSMVVFGSPGLGTNNLADLHIGGHLTVVENDNDPVAASGVFGGNPATIKGAHASFEQPSSPLAALNLVNAHTNYLDPGSQSEQIIVRAIVGSGS